MVMEEQESDMELASESIPVPQVQEPIIDAIERNKSGASRHKPRLRKKALYASILKLMEFYFSDANLSKDRYLSELLKNNPYVDLSEFTKFNKLRELKTDINKIAKALQGSTMLKVSEDGTKVCRTTPIKKKENVDECTVYVQNLPPDTDHERLESIFSKFGPVDYISIPRYKSNRKIKGFAFVEFDTPTSAQECIKVFRKKGCVLPSYTSPNDLLSISTFDDPKKDHTIAGKINKNTESKYDNEEKTDKTDDTLNNEMDTADNNDKKKRKYPEEKLVVKEESEVKAKKKQKNGANQNIDHENEKEAALTDEIKDTDDMQNNENNSKQKLKKRKLVPGNSAVEAEDNDNSHNSEKDMVDNSKQNLKKKKRKSVAEIENNDNGHNSEKDTMDNSKQNLKKRKGKSVAEVEDNDDNRNNEKDIIDNNKQNVRKRKFDSGKFVAGIEESDNHHNNEKETMDNNSKQNLRKRKTVSEKLVADNSDMKVNDAASSNIEVEESPNKNANKSPEKKKKRLTINEFVEDLNKETTKKDSHEFSTKSSKNKSKESEYLNKSDGERESENASQTEKHNVMKNVEIKSDVDEQELNGSEKKKKRNRKKRSKYQEDFNNAAGLQVMAKPEWKHLRNRYLELQRTKMSQLKQHLRKTQVERGEMMRNRWNCDKAGQNYEKDNYDKSKYEKGIGKINEAENLSSGRVSYAPGIIVKIEMDEPCTDPQSIKMELKDNNSIKYIDVTHGSCEAYVRCDTSEAAESFVQKEYEGRRLTVLKDDEEKSYWDKIAQDRAEKLNRKDRKQRGRTKLLKKAEKQLGKCIKFDQD